jgi:hypothetical protein
MSRTDVTAPRVLGPAQGLILGPPEATDRFMLQNERFVISEGSVAGNPRVGGAG